MNENCAYCNEGPLVDAFGIKITELPASKVYLFKEQSHRGRVIVASRHHVSEMIDLSRKDRQLFLDDVATVAAVLRKLFNPEKINYGAYGDTGCHLHFHLVPKYANDEFEWGSTFAMNPQRKFLSEKEYAELAGAIASELTVGGGNCDLRKSVSRLRDCLLSDGKIDYLETTILLESFRRLAGSGTSIDKMIALLEEVRSDGTVTADESAKLVAAIDDFLR